VIGHHRHRARGQCRLFGPTKTHQGHRRSNEWSVPMLRRPVLQCGVSFFDHLGGGRACRGVFEFCANVPAATLPHPQQTRSSLLVFLAKIRAYAGCRHTVTKDVAASPDNSWSFDSEAQTAWPSAAHANHTARSGGKAVGQWRSGVVSTTDRSRRFWDARALRIPSKVSVSKAPAADSRWQALLATIFFRRDNKPSIGMWSRR